MTISGPGALIAEDEIVTGEAVALDRQPLGLGLRLLGGLIDTALGWAIYLMLAVWAGSSLVSAGVLDEGTFQIFSVVMLVLCFAVMPIAVETLSRGRSLGKLAAGGQIVRADGGAIGFRHAFVRGLLGVLEIYMSFGGVALIVGMFTPRAQRLGDLMAGTTSERVRRTRLPDPAPAIPGELAAWAQVADVARLPDRLDQQVARFASGSAKLAPAARARIAADLARDIAPFVTPLPAVPADILLAGVAGVRRERERNMLRAENARVRSLAGKDLFVD